MSRITASVERQEDKKRYVITYDNRVLKWFQFLEDDVYEDPRRFSKFLSSLVQDVQMKSK